MGTRYASALGRELAREIAALGAGEVLTIAEAGSAGIVIWDVHRDQNGTLQSQVWPIVRWSDRGAASDVELRRVIPVGPAARLLFVRGSLEDPCDARAFSRLCYVYPQAPVFHDATPLDEVLRAVIADDTLTQWYELVVLRRTRSGRLVLRGCQLFPPSAQRGDRRTVRIRCEPSDAGGTVFAVIAAEPVRHFRLVSVESASVPPGSYDLTAELIRPGLVRFRGLPTELSADQRTWSELVSAIPARFDLPQPAHLICAVEVSGTADWVEERLSRIRQLIELAAAPELSVSVISYGSHSFARTEPEEPATMLTWESTPDAALAAVEELGSRGPAPTGYPRAAQIECVLAAVGRRLTRHPGRPVLVTAGSRPAFPHRTDPVSEILPCPARHDWRRELRRLREYPGIAFGAIHDSDPADQIWESLGREAIGHAYAMDIPRFAADLGLFSHAAQTVPFPLLEKTGS